MNDAIGAHSGTHKVTGLYYNFPTIPSHFLSRLENIFVAGFIKAADIARVGPSTALKELVDTLKELEDSGIVSYQRQNAPGVFCTDGYFRG